MRTPGLEPWEPIYTDPHTGEEIHEHDALRALCGPVPQVAAQGYECPVCGGTQGVVFPGERCSAHRMTTR